MYVKYLTLKILHFKYLRKFPIGDGPSSSCKSEQHKFLRIMFAIYKIILNLIKLKAWIIRAKHHFYNEGQNIILNKIRFNNNKNQLMCVRKSVKGKQNWNPLRRQKIIKKKFSTILYIFNTETLSI